MNRYEYFTPAEVKLLNDAIRERNFVVHGYFDKQHAFLLTTAEGRRWLVDNLHEIRDLLHSANRIVVSLCDRYWAEYGLDMETLKAYANELWETGSTPPVKLLH